MSIIMEEEIQLSPDETKLQEVTSEIEGFRAYLMKTFFPEDILRVKQLVYRSFIDPFPNLSEQQAEEIGNVVLGDANRRDYLNKTYHFIEMLSALKDSHSFNMMKDKAKESAKPLNDVISDALGEIKGTVEKETEKFEELLTSGTLDHAFKVKVDPDTGKFKISDLKLDKEELKTQWEMLQTASGAI